MWRDGCADAGLAHAEGGSDDAGEFVHGPASPSALLAGDPLDPPNIVWQRLPPDDAAATSTVTAGGDATRRSTMTAYIFTVNFILGSGVLAIPYAVQQAGIALTLGFMALITLLANLTMGWLVEVQSRLILLQRAYERGWVESRQQAERLRLLDSERTLPPTLSERTDAPPEPSPRVAERLDEAAGPAVSSAPHSPADPTPGHPALTVVSSTGDADGVRVASPGMYGAAGSTAALDAGGIPRVASEAWGTPARGSPATPRPGARRTPATPGTDPHQSSAPRRRSTAPHGAIRSSSAHSVQRPTRGRARSVGSMASGRHSIISFGTRVLTYDDRGALVATRRLPLWEEEEEQSAVRDLFLLEGAAVREIKDMCHVFGGPRWARLWSGAVSIQMACCMWLYFAVWCGSLMTIIPVPGLTKRLQCDVNDDHFSAACWAAYRIYLCLCIAIVAALSVYDLKAMSTIQTGLTMVSYVVLSVMIGTIIVAMQHGPYDDTKVSPNNSSTFGARSAPYTQRPDLVNFGGFGYAFTCLIWSQLCHMGCPAVTRVMPRPSSAKPIFLAAFVSTATVYTALALPAVFYFGDKTEKILTLNWKGYTAGQAEQGPVAAAVSSGIILFPAFSVTAALALYAKTLGMSIEGVIPLATRKAYDRWFDAEYDPKSFRVGPVRATTRIVAILLPAAGACAAHSVGLVVQLAGLGGFFCMFFFPVLLQVWSVRMLRALGLPSDTPYDNPVTSSQPAAATVGALSVTGLCYFAYLQMS